MAYSAGRVCDGSGMGVRGTDAPIMWTRWSSSSNGAIVGSRSCTGFTRSANSWAPLTTAMLASASGLKLARNVVSPR